MEHTESEIVVTNDGEVAALPASMQVYQAIYNEITGKTELLSGSCSNYLTIEMGDLFQLKNLLDQFLEQYEVSAFNSSITVFHTKANKERFSSFERLNTYNISTTSPIERINIELNLLITPPKLSKPQSYKVSLNIISGAAILGKTANKIPEEMSKLLLMRAVQEKAIEYEIEYVDYIIARSMSDLIKDWVTTIKEQEPNVSIKKLQDKSHLLKRLFTFGFFSMALIASIYYAKALLSGTDSDSALLAQYLIISGVSIILIKDIGAFLGRKVERSIDSINTNEISFIKINSGDQKLHSDYQKSTKTEKLSAIKSLVLGLSVGIASSIIATFIYNNLAA